MIAQLIYNAFSPRAESSNRDPLNNFWFDPDAAGSITTDSAFSISTVFACIYVRSNTVGALPWHVYEDSETEKKQKAKNHPWYEALHDRPNEWQTPIEFRSMAMAHLDLRGNFFARIDRRNGLMGRPSLVPLNPDRMTVHQLESMRLRYEYRYQNGATRDYSQDDILHVRGLSIDGLVGVTAFTFARETVSLTVAQQKHATKLFDKGGFWKYYLRTTKRMSSEARANFRKEWTGLAQDAEVPLLEDDMDIKTLGMTLEDAQWIESRKWTGREFCQFMRTPPHLVFLDDDSQANMEQKGLEWLTVHLNPELVRFEQAVQPWVGPGYFSQFNRDAIVRASLKERYEAHSVALGGRAFATVDEIRDREDLPALGGEAAKLPPPPNQSIPAKNAGKKYNNEAIPDEEDDEQALLPIIEERVAGVELKPLIADAADRIVAAEIKGLSRRADKAAENRTLFDEWVRQYYIKHADYTAKTLAPLCAAAPVDVSPLVAADEYCNLSLDEMSGQDVPALLSDWKLTKPARLAHILETALCPT